MTMISPMLGFVAYSGMVKLMKRMKSPAMVLKAYSHSDRRGIRSLDSDDDPLSDGRPFLPS